MTFSPDSISYKHQGQQKERPFFLAIPAKVPELALTGYILVTCSPLKQFLWPEENVSETSLSHRLLGPREIETSLSHRLLGPREIEFA